MPSSFAARALASTISSLISQSSYRHQGFQLTMDGSIRVGGSHVRRKRHTSRRRVLKSAALAISARGRGSVSPGCSVPESIAPSMPKKISPSAVSVSRQFPGHARPTQSHAPAASRMNRKGDQPWLERPAVTAMSVPAAACHRGVISRPHSLRKISAMAPSGTKRPTRTRKPAKRSSDGPSFTSAHEKTETSVQP